LMAMDMKSMLVSLLIEAFALVTLGEDNGREIYR